ncbi:hypothetical protein [Mangrovibacterium diazotrophicum]|uniref:Uncharacterized protein n=1 Tax=Mangrovibacterium diazotrophicum TaxID=1261403 RepID=A0A419W8D6_9BACT|nr:hypothetical protein [Mangrovibacterium diazotrophicum]RKD91714.1 hypothetical protein BC643_2078 [Mangrovibacterium diazotrophicum]
MDKQQEKEILQRFTILFDEFPKGKLQAGESPDFQVRLNTRKSIGIELTGLKGQDFIHQTGRLLNPSQLIENIMETIAAKEEKLYLYQRKKLHRIWLLIHAETIKTEVNFNLQNKLENLNFDSGFDRVFLFDLGSEQVYELG